MDTKKPWKADSISSDESKGIENNEGVLICECKEEYAQLISASPDLLEACKVALPELRKQGAISMLGASRGLVNKLQQAINKAEGR